MTKKAALPPSSGNPAIHTRQNQSSPPINRGHFLITPSLFHIEDLPVKGIFKIDSRSLEVLSVQGHMPAPGKTAGDLMGKGGIQG
jgi:hypothetical protein